MACYFARQILFPFDVTQLVYDNYLHEQQRKRPENNQYKNPKRDITEIAINCSL